MDECRVEAGSKNDQLQASEHSHSRLRMLIAGLHGFIGSHIALAAQSAGIDVIGLSLGPDIARAHRFHESISLNSVTAVDGDATDSKVIREAIDRFKPDILVNAVGVIRGDETTRWVGSYAVNYMTAAATVDALAATPPSQRPILIWIGSQAEYGEAEPPWSEQSRELPVSAYGVSKQIASALVLAGQRSELFNGCVIRLPIVFGPGQTPTLLIATAICAALSGNRIPMTAGQQIRRFAYAPDIAKTIVDLALRGIAGPMPSLLNSPGYEPCEIRKLIRILESLMPGRLEADLGALEYRPGELLAAWPDTSLADSLGLTPSTPLDQALEDTVSWYENNMWLVTGTSQ